MARFGILTGGGDAPGLNAVIRAVVLRCADRVLVRLGEFHAAAFSELEKRASRLPWEKYLAPIPEADVVADPQRPGRGWHVVTDYQRAQLGALLDDLESILAPLPVGTTTQAFGEVPAPYSVMPTARVVTHAQLDPVHRADPWPPLCDWLRRR